VALVTQDEGDSKRGHHGDAQRESRIATLARFYQVSRGCDFSLTHGNS
jgi:hypothetical protein